VAQYQVYRDGTLIVTTSNTTYSCVDLTPETQYCFTITASDHMDNVSEQSAPVCRATLSVSAPPPSDVVAPSMPNGVGAVATSATQVTVQWNASTDTGGSGLAGYRVYRGGTQIATVTTTSYSDTGLSPSTQYCYTIRAYDGAGNASSASASACVTTQNPVSTTPAAPSNLATMGVMSTHITLNWQDNSNNETGFRIERAPAGSGPWSVVGTTGVDATTYTDNGLAPSTAYWYRVAAFN
jgi:cellulose 1,4-beta-cellobiosidase